MKPMSEKSQAVLNYLKENGVSDLTAKDVAEALGYDKASGVNAIFNHFVTKGLGERIEVEIEKEDGSHEKIKLLKLTDAGKDFDPNAVTEE